MSRFTYLSGLSVLAGAAVIVSAASLAYAQNLDVIKQRREAMRTIAGASGGNFKMMKGDAPFDLAAFQANMKVIQEQAPKFKAMFPDDSKTGGGSDAAEKIWTARADFNTIVDKWAADAKVAAAAVTDEATFKTAYPEFAKGCGGCHMSTGGFTISLGESFKKPKP